MRFEYDPAIDAMHASFTDCVLATPTEVTRWEREVSAELSHLGRRVDLLIDMTGLVVKPAVSLLFGEARARPDGALRRRAAAGDAGPARRI